MQLIAVSHVGVAFGDRTVLRDVDFKITRGEVVGLLGRNGAGKTTLINTLIGLRPPTQGKVQVLGLDPVTEPRKVKSRVGIVHQRSNFDWELSVLDNLDTYARLQGLSKALRKRRIDEVLAQFELEKLSRRVMRQLSGGELRRMQVARALLHEPDLLVLDEPSANLDSYWRLRLQEMIREQAAQHGTTVLWTSHDLREIEEATTRILLLHEGAIAGDDHPRTFARRLTGEQILLHTPQTPTGLDQLPGVAAVARDEQWLVVQVDSAEERLAPILRYLEGHGARVGNVRVEVATLERAILKSNWGAKVS